MALLAPQVEMLLKRILVEVGAEGAVAAWQYLPVVIFRTVRVGHTHQQLPAVDTEPVERMAAHMVELVEQARRWP